MAPIDPRRAPPEEDVACRLHHALAFDDPLPGMHIGAGAKVCLEHRRGRLLELEDKGDPRSALKKDHEGQATPPRRLIIMTVATAAIAAENVNRPALTSTVETMA